MNIRDLCRRDVVTVRRGDDLTVAARLMRERHVGFLVVVELSAIDGALLVVGVVTDRDLVVSVLARDVDPRSLTVEDVMTRDPETVRDYDTLAYALAQMRRLGVRRLPVLNECGALAGIVSLDDLVASVARQLDDVAGSMRIQGRVEREMRNDLPRHDSPREVS